MCDFIKDNIKCCGKQKYGSYCYKHRVHYLCEMKDNYILTERFTNKESDYTITQLKKSLRKNNIYIKNINNKKELYKRYCEFINSINNYDNELIVKIQKFIKNKILQNNIKLRGPGFIDRSLCHNNEDFFTYDDKESIEDNYFISFKDSHNLVWCFDVRSLNKLLENDNKNPYTRELFHDDFLEKINKITHLLKVKNLKLNYNSEIIKERKENIKQITVDLFSEIEISGYDCNINWFLDLNLRSLKKLYRILEDIWNYRAQLSPEIKNNMVPPDGAIFNVSLNHIDRILSRRELQQIIINDVSKFKNAITPSDKTLGFMYFLMGLGHVSNGCYDSYPWLITG